jgi:NAD(P)-dependent dehydrogenase (short-subunit alcohol dehydrogenase family)
MRRLSQDYVYAWASERGNNVVTRQLQESCHALRRFDLDTPLNDLACNAPSGTRCYGCEAPCKKTHPVYVFSCIKCGTRFQEFRHLTRDLTGNVALVVGARTKLGHQIVLKLLQAGATVVGTTRYPAEAQCMYELYPEWPAWKDRLVFYPQAFDLDSPNISGLAAMLSDFIGAEVKGCLNIVVLCAAQTIRARDKMEGKGNEKGEGKGEGEGNENGEGKGKEQGKGDELKNRYGDSKFVGTRSVNSWQMRLNDLVQSEMEEVYRINAIAPCLLVQQLVPLLRKSVQRPYVISVHAREGLFNVQKSAFHFHTNMAKAGLAMLTRCLKSCRFRTDNGMTLCFHGCDPGWISVDEYYEKSRPWIVPPLDEVDGAARVLFPIMKGMKESCSRTRRHFVMFAT